MSHRTSPLDNEQCRQCTSFSDYIKQNRKKFQKENGSTAENQAAEDDDMPVMRDDCPLDKDELGNKSWGLLHTMAAKYPTNPTDEQKSDMTNFFTIFSKFYPCQYCAKDLREDLKDCPPKVNSQDELTQWLCRLHNRVNKKLGKDEFDCSKVDERWRDGWKDGSCG